ncbi:hypothetical protein [Desulfococcus sp.]|uniref:hypothetical protein n=1 Tax=Desulfococcus sp. TaxID=2025834 RepID=UPI0035943083
MRIPKRCFDLPSRCLLIFITMLCLAAPAAAKRTTYVPEVLQPWVDWVLHGKETQKMCAPLYNDPDTYQCAWPSNIELDLTDRGGTFRQTWLVHRDSWVVLPGSIRHWPLEVAVDGEARVVLQKEGAPTVHLEPGIHGITGRFAWTRLPEHLQVPAGAGIVSLRVNHEPTAFPNLDAAGRLWLKGAKAEEKIEDRLSIESFRLIDDAIPARALLHVTLDVAGSPRELMLGPLYPPEKFTPLSLESPLPARLDPDARMRVQLRPGRYAVRLTLRHRGPLQELPFHRPDDGFWPGQEIWSFHARPELRLVEIEGAPSVDPLQTSMPDDWKAYPAYHMGPGKTLRLKQIQRGDPAPAPDQLTLNRNIWLRFDGSGYTLQDQITGKKNTRWRLEMDPAITLGRVAVDGSEQLITRQRDSDKAGVELRNGLLNLTADSVYQGPVGSLAATGWDHDFQEVRGRLLLPPGWKLLHASGMDNISRTWVKRWTLLDFFVVLIFTVALAKLYSTPLAGIALLTLVLTYHEPGAPRYVWPALLVGFALRKHLPEGKFRKMVKACHAAAALALVVIAIPYAIHALRIGIYPQMEQPWETMTEYPTGQPARPQADMEPSLAPETMEALPDAVRRKAVGKGARALLESQISGGDAAEFEPPKVRQYDPDALTQTGPGMPRWRPFETIHFSWSGPVTRDQTVSFSLLGPGANLVLAFVRVFLILILALGMWGVAFRTKGGLHFGGAASLLCIWAVLLFLPSPGWTQGAEIPSPQLLEALQERLLEKDDCFPACSNIPEVRITITPDRLSLEASVESQIDAAIPVPSRVEQWMPREAAIDGAPAGGLLRKDDGLWVLVPAGRHTLRLAGAVRKQNLLQLPFPLKPHRVEVAAEGWTVEGLHPDGSIDAQLQFKRVADQAPGQAEILETGILPPFARVERNLLLGLVWKVHTTVTRLSPPGSGVVLDIPLLPGESVTTDGVRVVENIAKISLGADQTHLGWESFLAPADAIRLVHPETDAWTEVWRVDVSPIFHMETEGIPVILHQAGTRWYPTWHPWPGEAVTLTVTRPAGVKGQTLTIEESLLALRPGRKTTASDLRLSIKSSQGGQHTLSLPDGAELQEVSIQGKIQPIRQEGRRVTIPIVPGDQAVALNWIEPRGMAVRYGNADVGLGAPSVNAGIDIHLPRNRWPLFVGGEPLAGPAVLFWSVILLIAVAAVGLSKTRWTPLRMHQWFLLGIGVSMSSLAGGILIAAWLVALGFRPQWGALEGRRFNAMQIGMALLTIAAVGALVVAISSGLLGHPDMNITGNGSTGDLLKWYQDVSDETLPRAWVVSVPMFAYRAAMLAWALWVSFWLVGTLKWGWQRFTQPALWKRRPPRTPEDGRKEGWLGFIGKKETDVGDPETDPGKDAKPESEKQGS